MKKIDPICGMQGKFEAHGQWFCSEYCLKKYEKENGLSPENRGTACALEPEFFPSIGNMRLKSVYCWAIFLPVGLFFLSLFMQQLRMFPYQFLGYAGMVWFPLLVGFLIGGWIEVYVPRRYIIQLLAQNKPKTILRATALGFIFSGCSHGCLAIAFELYKKGASVPAVISFLLASPWANVSITLLLFGFFGIKGLAILTGALLISLISGVFFIWLSQKNLIEKNPGSIELLHEFSIREDILRRWKAYCFSFSEIVSIDLPEIFRGACHLAQMILGWVVIGISLASALGAVVPESFFKNWMGADLSGIGITLLFATMIEICSEGSSPLAFEIYRQTQAFGNSFVFLMAGVITDYTEIGLILSNVGKKTALWMVLTAIPLTLFLGTIFNFLF